LGWAYPVEPTELLVYMPRHLILNLGLNLQNIVWQS